MDNEILNLIYNNWKDIIIFITFWALFYQIRDSKKAIELSIEANNLTKKAINKDTQIREIELLPKVNFIINSQIILGGYIDDIVNIKLVLTKIADNPSNDEFIDEISKYYRDKKGLLIKNNKPIWLEQIEESATQYYYDLISCMNSFNKQDLNLNKSFAENLIKRADESEFYIKELLVYLDGIVPDVILKTPASINSSDFY